ncbi:hypothetical protein D3C87_1160860 [compost metagenome]
MVVAILKMNVAASFFPGKTKLKTNHEKTKKSEFGISRLLIFPELVMQPFL